MKLVNWVDERGWKRKSWIRDNDAESKAVHGVPAGPPDLDTLDWERIKKDINDVLVENDLLTWDNVQHSTLGLNAAVAILKRRLTELYRADDVARKQPNKDKSKK